MASDRLTFNIDGEDVEFELTEWEGTMTLLPLHASPWDMQVSACVMAGGSLVLLPKGHPELN